MGWQDFNFIEVSRVSTAALKAVRRNVMHRKYQVSFSGDWIFELFILENTPSDSGKRAFEALKVLLTASRFEEIAVGPPHWMQVQIVEPDCRDACFFALPVLDYDRVERHLKIALQGMDFSMYRVR